MKCTEINFIQYIEGSASAEVKRHIADCPACQEHITNLSTFMNKVMPVYCEGKKQELELDRHLAAMNTESMRPLPSTIVAKVKDLRENTLVGRLKRIIGDKKGNAGALIENMLHPQMDATPAIPKDITRAKKTKSKRKKASPKQPRKQKNN